MTRRAGFTLVETLLVVVVVGILTLMTYPRVNAAVTRSDIRGARTRVANMLATARTVATQSSRTARLQFEGNKVFVTATPRRTVGAGDRDTVGLVVDLNTVYGITTTLSNGTTEVVYDPRGLASGFGGDVTITLARGGHSQALKIDMLGRVTK
jgi:prepilin-type N-terminal cleavage/methylation domain-containing protein